MQQDVIPLLKEKWDMIIAFPPCTYFTTAGACRMFHKVDGVSILDEERYANAMKMKALFLAIYEADCPYICIENPTPMKVVGLPPPTHKLFSPTSLGILGAKELYYG